MSGMVYNKDDNKQKEQTMEHPMNIKERIGKLAEEVVAFYKDTNIPLTNAVAKIAKDYGLNNGEIEELCAKANHNVFREKYAGDKLAVFNIAQHKDAKDIIANKTKVAQTISAAPDIVIVEKIAEAVPLEDDQQEQWEEDRKKRNIANTTEAGESNADILNMLTVKRDDIVVGLYNTIKALYQSGSNLNEIYSVLSNTWGDQNKQETAKAFKSMVDKLKEEGYIEPNANYGEGEQPDMSDMEVVDSDIKTVAQKLAEVNNDIALHLIVHENIKSMLKTAGADIAAGDISKRILCGDYNNSSPLHKVAISKEISKVLGQALAATVIMSGIAGASTAGKSLIVAIKAPRVKKLILEKYPELEK